MYARSFDRDRHSIQVPEHYSGSLFSEHLQTQNNNPPVFPSIQDSNEQFSQENHPHRALHEEKRGSSEPSLLSPEIHETVKHLVDKISSGLGFERLLILGLMLLLSGVEGGSELILWLALLLFV
jgi:hypothetical protein